MTEPEMTAEEARNNYKENAADAADAAMIDFTALKEKGFEPYQAMMLVVAWHGKSIMPE